MITIGMILGVVACFIFLSAVLKWWSEGIYEASDAVIIAAVFCGLIFGMFTAQRFWQFIMAFIPLALITGYLIYSYKIGGSRSYYKSRCEGFIKAIQEDPRNLAAREYLAESYYALGQLEQAVDELQAAVDLGAGMETKYKLNMWVNELARKDSVNPICKWCNTQNQQGTRICTRCGSDLPFETAFSRWLTGGKTSTIRYYLLIIIGIGIISVSILVLPIKFAFIPVLLFLAVIAGWALVSSAK